MRQDEERRVNPRPCRVYSNITWRTTLLRAPSEDDDKYNNNDYQKLTKQETNLAAFTQKVKLGNVCDTYYDDGYYKDNKNWINLKHA